MALAVRKVLPLLDRILIKRIEQMAPQTGIVVPKKEAERIIQAHVIAVGPGVISPKSGTRITPIVKEGDRVLVADWGGDKVELEDETVLQVISESQVLAKLE